MIQLYQLQKRYHGTDSDTLVDVSFELEAGEFAFLRGPSGAGKTTLLKILFGMQRPTAGQALVDGRNLARLTGRQVAALRRSVGFIFQDFRLLDDRSALDNIQLPLQVRGTPAAEARKLAEEELDRVGMTHRAKVRPPALSAGEQQRIAIARALVGSPSLLLADEPTGNLDPELSLRVMELFVDAQVRGTAVLVATHNPELPARFKRRVIRLEGGRVVTEDGVPAPAPPPPQPALPEGSP